MIPDGIEPLVEWLAERYEMDTRMTQRAFDLHPETRWEFHAALLTLVARVAAGGASR